MIEQGMNDLNTAINACAQEMQRMCIVKNGMNRVWSTSADRREWHGPTMIPNLHFAGIDLNMLPKHLYQGPQISPVDARSLWDRCVTAMFERQNFHQAINEVCPDLPLFGRTAPPTELLVQLLCVMWWACGGKMNVTSMEVVLNIRGDKFLLDQRSVTHGTTRSRLLRGGAISPRQCVSRPLGRARLALPATTALYRHMCANFPGSAREMDVIFSTAVTAGLEFQKALTHLFDLESVTVDDLQIDVWARCRRIVNTSTTTPCSELWALLKGKISYHAFVKLFGNPHPTEQTPYRALTRKKHAASLDKVEGGEINFSLLELTGDQAAEVNNLLQLQRMMGSAI